MFCPGTGEGGNRFRETPIMLGGAWGEGGLDIQTIQTAISALGHVDSRYLREY